MIFWLRLRYLPPSRSFPEGNVHCRSAGHSRLEHNEANRDFWFQAAESHQWPDREICIESPPRRVQLNLCEHSSLSWQLRERTRSRHLHARARRKSGQRRPRQQSEQRAFLSGLSPCARVDSHKKPPEINLLLGDEMHCCTRYLVTLWTEKHGQTWGFPLLAGWVYISFLFQNGRGRSNKGIYLWARTETGQTASGSLDRGTREYKRAAARSVHTILQRDEPWNGHASVGHCSNMFEDCNLCACDQLVRYS